MSVPDSGWTNTRLVAHCLAGDERAWNVLLDRYKNLIYSIPLRYGLRREDAADIFQAVCLDLFNELARLRDAEALQGWLVQVAAHKCYHWKRRQPPPEDRFSDEVLEAMAGTEPMAAETMAEIEREQMVREAMAGLPPRCRAMIEALFFEQPPVPYEEVARRFNLAKGSIGFIRARCLKKLKQELERRGF